VKDYSNALIDENYDPNEIPQKTAYLPVEPYKREPAHLNLRHMNEQAQNYTFGNTLKARTRLKQYTVLAYFLA
jgi:hypothetical protein